MLLWKRLRSRQSKTNQSSNVPIGGKEQIISPDLFDIQADILGRNGTFTIIEANTYNGWWSEQYLKKFERSHVIAIEPNQENFAIAAARLTPLGGRVELIHAALASVSVANSPTDVADAGRSTLAPANSDHESDPLTLSAPHLLSAHKVSSLTVDDICAERATDLVDILKLHINGSGVEALKGAERMLARGAIRLLLIRVSFLRGYNEMPAFEAVAGYLRRFGYGLQGIYETRREPPILLREAEALFVAPHLQARPEIPPLPDETIESIEGRRLPDRFLRMGLLQDGAAIRPRSMGGDREAMPHQSRQNTFEVASILNATIDTSAESHLHSLLFHADAGIGRQLHEGELIVAEVAITVVSGQLGIVWVDQLFKPLEARERQLSAMPGVQRVLASAPTEHACHLVFRNRSTDSTRATFKIVGIRTKIAGASFRSALKGSGAEALYLRAYARERAGDREGAARLFAEALALMPDHAPALEGLGELLDVAGHPKLAMDKYDTLRKLRSVRREGPPDRCLVLRRRGPYTDQIAAFSSLLHSVNHGVFPYVARGSSFLSEGRGGEALRDYESALELKPDLPEVVALKGEALNMLGCYREALQAFDFAVAERPRDPEILSGRAVAHLGTGKLEAADADWCRQLALLTPVHASARACVALRLADYEVAATELERALVKEPHDPYWRLYHTTALRRLGRSTSAIDPPGMNDWPGPLLALHAGQLRSDDVLKKADNDCRRAEALFQLGVLALPTNIEEARRSWTELVAQSTPDLIEYAAARHELARIRS